MIGHDLNDETNAVNGAIFGGQISGAGVGGPSGDDEAQCNADRGREIWVRLTLRPLELMKRSRYLLDSADAWQQASLSF